MFGYKIKEVPVTWYHREGSKLNVLRDYLRTLWDLIRMRLFIDYATQPQPGDEHRRV